MKPIPNKIVIKEYFSCLIQLHSIFTQLSISFLPKSPKQVQRVAFQAFLRFFPHKRTMQALKILSNREQITHETWNKEKTSCYNNLAFAHWRRVIIWFIITLTHVVSIQHAPSPPVELINLQNLSPNGFPCKKKNLLSLAPKDSKLC